MRLHTPAGGGDDGRPANCAPSACVGLGEREARTTRSPTTERRRAMRSLTLTGEAAPPPGGGGTVGLYLFAAKDRAAVVARFLANAVTISPRHVGQSLRRSCPQRMTQSEWNVWPHATL